MLLLRLSGSAIGGIVTGVCGFVLLLVGLFFWYHWRHRRPGILPQEVLDAEFTFDGGNDGGEVDSSTHLTPFLHNAATRYLASSVVPITPPPRGSDSPERRNPSSEKLRLRTREEDTQTGVVLRGVVAVVPNVVTPEEDTRNARMQVEGRVQDFGPISYVLENDEGILPPDYQQATEPFHTGDVE